MPVAPLLSARDITRRRFAAGSRNGSGVWVDGAATDSTIRASVQPLSGSELQRLPEGERERRRRKVYVRDADDLRVASQFAQHSADRLLIDGDWYEVEQLDDWSASRLLPHWRAQVVEFQEADG